MSTKKAEPYPFVPEFERQLGYLCSARPKFWGRIGHALDEECITDDAVKRAFRAAKAIAQDTGSGPSSVLQVVQRIRRWMDDGNVKHEELAAVVEMFDSVEDAGVMEEEAAVLEVTPVLRQRLHHDVVTTAIKEYGSKGDGDMGKVISMVERAQRLGTADTNLGTRIGSSSFQAIESVRHLERLPTGIMELDAALGNGVPRGQMGCLIGGAGDGKSMGLNHIAGYGMRAGLFVGYATLELPEYMVMARLIANVTGETIDSILEGNPEAKRKLEKASLGTCVVKPFTPQMTTVDDVHTWVKECEDAEGRQMDLLIVDYADKCTTRLKGTSGKKDSGDGNLYSTMELVYEGFRIHAERRKTWIWTASQAVRRGTKDKKRVRDLDDVSDSLGKVRVVDVAITLNVNDEGTMMEYFVGKNRTGKSRVKVGPLPVDWAHGSMCVKPPDDDPAQGDLLNGGLGL